VSGKTGKDVCSCAENSGSAWQLPGNRAMQEDSNLVFTGKPIYNMIRNINNRDIAPREA